ncbi:TPA: aminopeptidase [Candidatus Avigastranaerophilus faecigallinarum]|nr:aminopeptidase [Candidatus Avigastranaerophilus faecigallinarum]
MNKLWEKYAKVLVDYSVKVQKGELTIIRTDSYLSQPLVKEIYKQVLLKGAYPVVRMGVEGLNEVYIKNATDEQLEYIDPMTEIEYEKAKNLISIGAPLNLKNMARLDSKKLAKRSSVMKHLSEKMLKRAAEGDLKWVIADFPTNALAQEAKMSLEEYTEFLIKSCYLHEEDPVSKWIEIGEKQEKIADYLNKKSKIRIVGDKTDITFNVAGRIWKSCAGECNFPDGEVYTSPVEDSANGQIYFDFPQLYRGNEAQKVLLTLKDGKVIDAKAEKGEDFLNNMLDMDEGSRFVGEIAIGTNDMIQDVTGNILFDEKIGGSIHMAVGASYPDTGGKNVSGLHWDLIKNMKNGGQIYADDELIYENGKFLI